MPLGPVLPPLVPLILVAGAWRVPCELRLALYDQYPTSSTYHAHITAPSLLGSPCPISLIHMPVEPRRVGIIPLGAELSINKGGQKPEGKWLLSF